MDKEKTQTMKLNDNELEMVNGGINLKGEYISKKMDKSEDSSNCPYNKGGQVDKYNICAGKQYVAWDFSSWNIVVALSDNFEENSFIGTDTYARFRILSSTDPSKVGQTKKWGLGKWHHHADIYETK